MATAHTLKQNPERLNCLKTENGGCSEENDALNRSRSTSFHLKTTFCFSNFLPATCQRKTAEAERRAFLQNEAVKWNCQMLCQAHGDGSLAAPENRRG